MAKRVMQFAAVGKTKAYEDTSFTQAESPRVLEAETDLGRPANFGYMINDGPGNIQFAIQNHEQNDYGDLQVPISLRLLDGSLKEEARILMDLDVDKKIIFR